MPIDPRQAGDIEKAALFLELGYGGDPARYDAVLAPDGLTNSRKRRVALSKRDTIRALLASRFFRACARGDCRSGAKALAGGRAVVPASRPAMCEVCAGSVNRRVVNEMVAAALRAGGGRLCVVGGAPNTRQALAEAVAGRMEVHMVDGTLGHSRAEAADNLRWADLVVVWGATQLDHRVSSLYAGDHVITVARRGISELAGAARDWFLARPGRGRR